MVLVELRSVGFGWVCVGLMLGWRGRGLICVCVDEMGI